MSLSSKIWHPFTQEKTAPEPIKLSHASGENIYTQDGKKLVDLVSSWWLNPHGHANQKIADAIYEQAQKLEHVIFAGFMHEPAQKLADNLIELLGADFSKVFFSDNGSTAVEIGAKIAYQYWHNKGEKRRRRFVSFEHGYHGDTFGAMSLGAANGFFDPFQRLFFEVDFMPYPSTWINDTERREKECTALQKIENHMAKYHKEIVAMIIEPIMQGAGGMRNASTSFMNALMQICKKYGVLTIFDECMTGFGRTGKMFAFEHLGKQNSPDIICLAKALTGGFLPLSATVTKDYIYQEFLSDSFDKAFAHGHSFTANPLGCAAANASIEIFAQENVMQKIAAIELEYREFYNRLVLLPNVEKIRIVGTILAFDVVVDADESGYNSAVGPVLKKRFLDAGYIIRPLGNVVYVLPPFCIDIESSLRPALDKIIEVISSL